MRLALPEGGRVEGTIELAGRVIAGRAAVRRRVSEESPDTTGQDAGETPGGESRRKVAQKGDRQRRTHLSAKASRANAGSESSRLCRHDDDALPKVRVKRWGKSPPAPW